MDKNNHPAIGQVYAVKGVVTTFYGVCDHVFTDHNGDTRIGVPFGLTYRYFLLKYVQPNNVILFTREH